MSTPSWIAISAVAFLATWALMETILERRKAFKAWYRQGDYKRRYKEIQALENGKGSMSKTKYIPPKITQWFKQGDHPQVKPITSELLPPYLRNYEGCPVVPWGCARPLAEHGIFKDQNNTFIVCPGYWIIEDPPLAAAGRNRPPQECFE